MKKLLHELLRMNDGSYPQRIKIGKVDVCLYPVEAQALADEIEKYYIQLPCDPEGKPWNIGDPVNPLNAKIDSYVTGYIYDGEEWYLQYRYAGRYDECDELAKNCKRPQPKILDADGVEIKVGDTVWRKKIECKVIEIKDGLYPVRIQLNEVTFWTEPDLLTHKEPDSLEKLRDDMAVWSISDGSIYEGYSLSIIEGFTKRLSALIERGA